ncbi:hypothetical protein TIFTF001_029070 [Ficus carica]|uniref:Uncharacterized protein n=1 Tax=Ficus carica TaxID=3494 RepID=A0AA88IXH2_FICCA|nr:hypothetical protein TIFTF001_029070 [Ficus carica]
MTEFPVSDFCTKCVAHTRELFLGVFTVHREQFSQFTCVSELLVLQNQHQTSSQESISKNDPRG